MKKKYKYINTLRVERAKHRLTQKELGENVGMTRQTIANIENKEPPTLLKAILLANYFNVNVEDIFSFEEITD